MSSRNLQHVFNPVVTVTLREDGRYRVQFDWSDSYQYAFDTDTESELSESEAFPECDLVCAAVDSWVTDRHPIIIPPADSRVREHILLAHEREALVWLVEEFGGVTEGERRQALESALQALDPEPIDISDTVL